MGCACSVDLGHAAKVIVLRLGSMVFDVISDVGNGVYQYNPKTVTRNLTLFGNFTAPENCVPDDDNNTSGMFNCQEEDIEWAALTFVSTIIHKSWASDLLNIIRPLRERAIEVLCNALFP